MSKTKGNVVDPLRADRRLRRRRAALRPARLDRAGPRRQVRPEPGRGLPQLRHQALERRPLRPDERGAGCDPASTRPLRRSRSTAGSSARRPEDGRGGHRGARGLPLQRRRAGRSTTSLGHLLRLVRRARQAAAHWASDEAPGGDARHRRLGAGAGPASPASRWRPSSPRSCGSSCSAGPAGC